MYVEAARILDRLIWDYPLEIDLLNIVRDTPRAHVVLRNVRALYRNDSSTCITEHFFERNVHGSNQHISPSNCDIDIPILAGHLRGSEHCVFEQLPLRETFSILGIIMLRWTNAWLSHSD